MRAPFRQSGPRTPVWHWVALILLLVGAVGAQVLADGVAARVRPAAGVSWIRSTELMQRLVLDFDAIASDVYWIRAVQYYGDTKLSKDESKNYDLLYPLLDMATSLDPGFKIAYRFGAILLSEGYPNGPARPDYAIALLEKGIRQTPDRWEYFHDAGFVEYWWRQDYEAASAWFLKASRVPNAPNWLAPVAASMLAEGGAREAARLLWSQLAETAEQDWLRQTASRALLQLDAEAVIEQLRPIVNRYHDVAGRFPSDWSEVVRAGLMRGIPLDPSGTPYALDPVSGVVNVAPGSKLYPLRRRRSLQ